MPAASQTREADDLVTRISLLIGQAFFLGLTLGLLIVAAIALLISTYGSGALPYVYIVVAILGSAAFYGFAEVQRRWTLVQVSIATEMIIVAFLGIAWTGLVYAGLEWLSFAAMVAFSLIIQVGFVIIGGQAGRLLDVRQIKRYFPRIVAGFVVGFMVAGALVSPLQNRLGATEYLLLAAAISASIMLVMLLATNARYYRLLAQASEGGGPVVESPPLRKLLAKRFVILIFAYQMLSAMVSQLLDFMVMAAAGERFLQSDTLAAFFGSYTFLLNLTDLLFLALAAGVLLSRFGLRFGLIANPAVDILVLVAIVVTGLAAGPGAVLFFWLVAIVRVIDITFTDGTTRTSINTTFQALPPSERVSVQTGVEGIGVPLALGLTGVTLLVFEALGETTLLQIAAFTLVVSFFWMASALYVYRDYAANLVQSMRRRALAPVELNLEDKANLDVTKRLLRSERLNDVCLALDMLEGVQHPTLSSELMVLAESQEEAVQMEALARIGRLQLQEALPMVRNVFNTATDARVRGVAIRTYCALNEAEAVERVVPYLDDPEEEVRLGAAVGLLRYGSIPGVLAVGQRLESWQHAANRNERSFLARLIAEVGLAHVYQPLMSLLVDPDVEVRIEALNAAGQVRHPRLLPLIDQNLADRATRSAASEALVLYGDEMLPLVQAALVSEETPVRHTVRLVRLCGLIKGEQVEVLMRRNIDHSQDEVRDQIMAVLGACGFHGLAADMAALNRALTRDANHGHRMLIALQDVGVGAPVEPLQRALEDEFAQVRRRIFWLLSFIYDAQPVMRAQFQLETGSGAERALALEMLDVTLSAEHRTLAFPLIDPNLERAKRIEILNKRFNNESQYRERRLQALIKTSGQAWIRACALYAAANLAAVGQLAAEEFIPLIEAGMVDEAGVVRETAAWSLHKLAPRRFDAFVTALMGDEDQRVAAIAAELIEK